MRRKILIGIALALVATSTAVAQQSMDGPYILHEYFTDIESTGGQGGAQSPAPAPAETRPGQPPSLSLEARPGEPIYAEDGPVFEEEIEEPYGPLTPFGGSNTLDDRTDRVDSLTYYSNFEPSVIPYKRVVAQNRVVVKPSGEYAVELRAGENSPANRAGQAPASSEVFWGTFLLRLEPGQYQPIASVAPDQTLLRIETEPDVAVDIARDRADNYYVRSRVGGLVRLNLQIAAPSYYFNGDFVPVRWEDFPADRIPPMNPALEGRALRLATSLGFGRDQPPHDVIVEMVRYFRGFDARPLPDELKDEDRLSAIVENQIGVCRHRSLAFVVIAQALGIPTRYVYNEAHAFVEVFWPGHGWRRVDLGGAADELNASATEGRSMHDTGPDELPKPERYVEEQERMARNGWNAPGMQGEANDGGATGDSADGANGELQPDDSEREGQNGNSNAEMAAAGTNGTNGAHGPFEAAEVDDADLPPPAFTEPPADDRVPTTLSIDEATAVVRRGGELRLAARLSTAQGQPLRGKSVEVYLGPVGTSEPGTAVRLGEARTDQRGRVRTRVTIPREHSIGRWSLFLVFAGDSEHRPAIAE